VNVASELEEPTSTMNMNIEVEPLEQSGPIRGKSGGFRFGCRRDFVVHPET
jgi:hypothetical protein